MAAYVVSGVTTRTGVAAGGGPPAVRARSSGANFSMSVDLVFMGSDGPDGLERELVGRGETRRPLAAVLCAQHHPLALPQRERGDELPRDEAGCRGRGLDVVVAHARDPALAQLVGGGPVTAQVSGAAARRLPAQRDQLAAQRPLAGQRLG